MYSFAPAFAIPPPAFLNARDAAADFIMAATSCRPVFFPPCCAAAAAAASSCCDFFGGGRVSVSVHVPPPRPCRGCDTRPHITSYQTYRYTLLMTALPPQRPHPAPPTRYNT